MPAVFIVFKQGEPYPGDAVMWCFIGKNAKIAAEREVKKQQRLADKHDTGEEFDYIESEYTEVK